MSQESDKQGLKYPNCVKEAFEIWFEQAPCFICGYSGEGYYQLKTHSCAKYYHEQKLFDLFLQTRTLPEQLERIYPHDCEYINNSEAGKCDICEIIGQVFKDCQTFSRPTELERLDEEVVAKKLYVMDCLQKSGLPVNSNFSELAWENCPSQEKYRKKAAVLCATFSRPKVEDSNIRWILWGLINDLCGASKNADDALNREKLIERAVAKLNGGGKE